MPDYKELGFYQKSREMVKNINSAIKTWPKTMQAQEVSRQLFRAATSVGANIAEGHGRHAGPEYIHFLLIAQGSANEVDHWLNIAHDSSLSPTETLKRLLELNNEIRKMLHATINSLQTRQNSKVIRDTPATYFEEDTFDNSFDEEWYLESKKASP